MTAISLVVFGKTSAISAARTYFVSFQKFSLLLLYAIFLNTNVLCKFQVFRSSVSSKSVLISLSWSANFLYYSANLKLKLSISSLFCFNILIASSVLFSTTLIPFCKSTWTASNLFPIALSFTSKANLLLISALISSI